MKPVTTKSAPKSNTSKSRAKRAPEVGYTPCACRDCMETAIGVAGVALCHDCEAAGCEANGGECCAPDAYGG